MENTIQKSTPRDVFLYLLTVITLYISIWRFIALLFGYIDVLLPDRLNYSNPLFEIRMSIASLLIVFPVYMALTWHLRKDCIRHPEKLQMKVRKWLLNFTLFITAITIIVDLIVLINDFLQGELTMNFLLRVLVVLVVAAGVFSYYLWDLRRDTSPASKPSKLLAWSVSFVILASVVCGFFIVGSPMKERLYKFDERRVNDLQMLQGQVSTYWQQTAKLPESLPVLANRGYGFVVPRDPETNADYEYRQLGGARFELCANFAMPSRDEKYSEPYYDGMAPYPMSSGNENYKHEAGRKCFTRTVDKNLYPPFPKM